MNQKGIAHIVILLVLAALVAAGVGGYLYLTNNDNSLPFTQKSLNLTDDQKKELEQAEYDTQELASIIDAAQGLLDSDAMEGMVDAVVEERRQQIKEEAQSILNKNPCDAKMSDIDRALQLASDAWLATDGELGDALWEWAREAFRGYVVDAALAVGATFLEQDIDLFSMSYEERKVLYAQARERFYDRALLAQQAQLFGFEDIHRKIMAGEFLQPVCVQLWDVKAEVEYYLTDHNQAMVEHWKMDGTMKEVPIYKYSPELGLPEIEQSASEKGNFEIIEMWWREASDSPIGATYTKVSDPYWKLKVDYEENLEDFWQDEVVVQAKIDVFEGKAPKVYSDYFGEGEVVQSDVNGGLKMRIPALKLWKREPFSYSEETDNTDEAFVEKVTTKVYFYPNRRVRVEDL